MKSSFIVFGKSSSPRTPLPKCGEHNLGRVYITERREIIK